MLKKKGLVVTFALVLLSLILVACGGETETAESSNEPENSQENGDAISIKLGHVGSAGDVFDQSVEVFDNYIQEHTDGRYIIENYGQSQLGNERDLIEGVTLGTVDMTLVTNAPMGNFVPEALFFDLPAIYQDLDHVHKVAESPIVQENLAEKLLEQDMRLLTVTDGGFRNITNNVRPIHTMDDLDGIKMRVQESPMIVETYNALPGISPTPIPMGELYTSLEQGIVDAQENPTLMIYDFKFHEVQEYLTLTGHSYFPRYLLINENLWQDIPEEDREIFQAAADEMQTFKNDFYERENEKMIEALEAEGMEVNEPDEEFLEEFFDIMYEEVYPQFYDEIGSGDEEKGKQIVEDIIKMGE